MTLPSSGPLTLGGTGANSIDREFGKGANLSVYRGVQWWKDNTQTGFFTSTNLGMDQFYEKRGTTPVTSGSQTLGAGSGSWTVPLYSTLTVVTRGGGGGGGGGGSNSSGGSAGGAGGGSNFGPYVSSGGGGGGGLGNNTPGASGSPASDGTPAGGRGGGAGVAGALPGGSGGAGGKNTVVLTNPISGGSGPNVGSPVGYNAGFGGGGGGGQSGVVYTGVPPFYYQPAPGGSGGSGGNGYIELSWS